MSTDDVRRGVTQAKANADGAGMVGLTAFICATIIGIKMQSFGWFIAILFGSLFLSIVRPFTPLITLAMAAIWGWSGFAFGSLFSEIVSYALGAIGAFLGAGAGLLSAQHSADLAPSEEASDTEEA